MIRSKYVIPKLAGARRPAPPGPKPTNLEELKRWQRRADRVAQYFGTLHVPWDTETGKCPAFKWSEFCAIMAKWGDNDRNPTWLQRCRYQSVNLIATSLRVPAEDLQLQNLWRTRACRKAKEDGDYFDPRWADDSELVPTSRKDMIDCVNAYRAVYGAVADRTATADDIELAEYKDKLLSTCDRLNGRGSKVDPNRRKLVEGLAKFGTGSRRSRFYKVAFAKAQRKKVEATDFKPPPPTQPPKPGFGDPNNVKDPYDEQKKFLDFARKTLLAGPNDQLLALLTGPPGSGKTVAANLLLKMCETDEELRKFEITAKFTATSGNAAAILGGTTIDYLCNLGRHYIKGTSVESIAVGHFFFLVVI